MKAKKGIYMYIYMYVHSQSHQSSDAIDSRTAYIYSSLLIYSCQLPGYGYGYPDETSAQ